MKKGASPNPAELRMILAENLQLLTSEVTSISDLCREIGVNRTQFNRYLGGAAFPRPDVLFRICSYFGVDANILLRRIDATVEPAAQLEFPLRGPLRPFDHYMLPDGMYRYWRKSFRQPERAYLGLAQITTKNGLKLWKGYDIHDQPNRAGSRRFSRSLGYTGTLIQHFDGFTLMSSTPYNDLMNITFFEYGLDSHPDYYSGISFVTRRRLAEANRLVSIVMQRLPKEPRHWINWARECGSHPITSVPAHIRAALQRVPDHI